MPSSDPRIEQAQHRVNIGDRAHRRMRSTAQALLVHDNRHAQVLDGVGFGLGVAGQEVLHERAEGFIELASSFSGDGVEDNRRLAGTGYACEDGDFSLGYAQ